MKLESNFRNWGPYLSFGTDASKEVRISWQSEQFLWENSIKWGLTPKCENAIKEEYPEPRIHHIVILSNLTPATKYYYQILNRNDTRDTQVYSFETGPTLSEPCTFDFTVLGDLHANGLERIRFGEVFEAVKRNVPQNKFYVTVGDSVDDGHREVDYEYFFETVNPFLSETPMMNTTGNHDCGTRAKYARFVSVWDHPYADKHKGGFYTFQYGNAFFVMVDSDNGGTLGTVLSDDQMEWLEPQLEHARAKNLWIFVCFHRQMYSTGDFSMEPILHQYLRPIFDQYHVDCVMYGHDHNYQLFWLTQDTPWGGTKYIVAGAAGGPQRSEWKILGPNNGETIYVWPGNTYSYARDGILPRGKEKDMNISMHRMDDICKHQIYAVLTPNFVHFHIAGDKCTIRCIGFQDQPYHTITFEKTNKGD